MILYFKKRRILENILRQYAPNYHNLITIHLFLLKKKPKTRFMHTFVLNITQNHRERSFIRKQFHLKKIILKSIL